MLSSSPVTRCRNTSPQDQTREELLQSNLFAEDNSPSLLPDESPTLEQMFKDAINILEDPGSNEEKLYGCFKNLHKLCKDFKVASMAE